MTRDAPTRAIGTPASTYWEPLSDGGAAPAVVQIGPSGPRTITYDELIAMRDAVAHVQAETIGAGSRVGILADASIEWLVAYYAALWAGGVIVPLSPKLPAAGLRHAVADAELHAIFIDEGTRQAVEDLGIQGLRLLDVDAATTASIGGEVLSAATRPADDEALVLYTSGSTGRPKGVSLGMRTPQWIATRLGPALSGRGARVLVAAPLHHMNGLMTSMASLYSGATVVLLPRFEPRSFLRAIPENDVTDLSGVPPMFAMLREHVALLENSDVSHVTRVTLGSSPISEELLRQVESWFPEAHVAVTYGTTECGPGVFAPHPSGSATPLGSVGAASDEPEIRLVDSSGAIASGKGVLEVRGPALMRGYRNAPAAEASFTPDGFYHTGDLFEQDDQGFYFFRGREDDMFVSGGENIHPAMVEKVLESHPAVVQAHVVGVPDEIKGMKPAAFVLMQDGFDLDTQALQSFTLDHLEPFAHPRWIWRLESLPLTAANKVDRHELGRRAAALVAQGDS